MDIKKINALIAEKRWTEMLKELPAGQHTIPFPNVEAIRSCKAVAYSINSDNKVREEGNTYLFNVDKSELSAIITVSELKKNEENV